MTDIESDNSYTGTDEGVNRINDTDEIPQDME